MGSSPPLVARYCAQSSSELMRDREIEAELALDRQGLQGEGAVGAADQDVGAGTDDHRGFRRGADISAGERTAPDSRAAPASTAHTITVSPVTPTSRPSLSMRPP